MFKTYVYVWLSLLMSTKGERWKNNVKTMHTGCLREIRLHMWEKKITDRLLTCNTANHSFVNENKLFFNEEGKAKQSRAGTGLTMLVWAHSFLEPQFLRLENGVGTVGLLWLRIKEMRSEHAGLRYQGTGPASVSLHVPISPPRPLWAMPRG